MEKHVKSPHIGAVVIFHPAADDRAARHNHYSENDEAPEIAAVITAVHGQGATGSVNLKAIPDGPGTLWRTSVSHQTCGINPKHPENKSIPVVYQQFSWRWPDEPCMVSDKTLAYSDDIGTDSDE